LEDLQATVPLTLSAVAVRAAEGATKVQPINTWRFDMTITKEMASLYEANTWRLFLIRGVVAITWAAVFAAVADSPTFGIGALLVLYPLIDVVASLVDARGQDGSARWLLLAGAVTSIVAAVALGIAATASAASVFAVFGVWAVLAGAAQLVTALRRRAQLGPQLPMVLAGVGSVGFGLAFLIASNG
jgi:uncharacterized membrane protein HdeD (DUF308 family)